MDKVNQTMSEVIDFLDELISNGKPLIEEDKHQFGHLFSKALNEVKKASKNLS